jgi:hypothetical protein
VQGSQLCCAAACLHSSHDAQTLNPQNAPYEPRSGRLASIDTRPNPLFYTSIHTRGHALPFHTHMPHCTVWLICKLVAIVILLHVHVKAHSSPTACNPCKLTPLCCAAADRLQGRSRAIHPEPRSCSDSSSILVVNRTHAAR